MPEGLEYLGTHHTPLTEGSDSTYCRIMSMSGPFSSMGMLIISMPNSWQMAKCRSYPGTGQRNFSGPCCPQGRLPP